MREILFKGKLIDQDTWVEGFFINNRGDAMIFSTGETTVGMFHIEPDTICQFTGLYDKYGTKIFENDIVQLPQMIEKGRVKWANSQPAFVIELSEQVLILDDYRAKQIEVLND